MIIEPKGPIEHFLWGKFVICGNEHSKDIGVGKDIRLIGKDVTKWEEREGHKLTPSMITGIGNDIDVLIIGYGVEGDLECSQEVKKSIEENGIKELILEKTPKACRTYNRLFNEGKRVALLAHGTC